MKYRKLRIALTGFALAISALAIGFNVRSYVYEDRLLGPLVWPSCFSIESSRGRVRVYLYGDRWDVRGGTWYRDRHKVDYGWPLGPRWQFTQLWPGAWTVVVPHWFPAVIAALIAALPWLKWRFSVRTLLIVMTLISLGLGAIVYGVR